MQTVNPISYFYRVGRVTFYLSNIYHLSIVYQEGYQRKKEGREVGNISNVFGSLSELFSSYTDYFTVQQSAKLCPVPERYTLLPRIYMLISFIQVCSLSPQRASTWQPYARQNPTTILRSVSWPWPTHCCSSWCSLPPGMCPIVMELPSQPVQTD